MMKIETSTFVSNIYISNEEQREKEREKRMKPTQINENLQCVL